MIEEDQNIQYQHYEAGHFKAVTSGIVVENPVSLTVNGDPWLTFMCTPVHLEALAAGFLFNEGLITSAKEIASIRVCPNLDNVDIWLHHQVEKPSEWRRTSGCTGGVTGVKETSGDGSAPLSNDLVLSPGQITALIGQLFEAQDLYRRTGGIHTSALSDGRTIHLAAEDIGRHNTLDKIAGRCLLEGVQIQPRVLLSTGRISSEMLQKAHRIGAAMLISRTSPSSLSVRMAKKRGITLIGYARRNAFNIYTHPERVSSFREIQALANTSLHHPHN
jgi:FdhD protein